MTGPADGSDARDEIDETPMGTLAADLHHGLPSANVQHLDPAGVADVMLEAATTSFQVHLQAPAVALAAGLAAMRITVVSAAVAVVRAVAAALNPPGALFHPSNT